MSLPGFWIEYLSDGVSKYRDREDWCSQWAAPVAALDYTVVIPSISPNILVLILEPWSENTKLKYFCPKENLKTSENSLKEPYDAS